MGELAKLLGGKLQHMTQHTSIEHLTHMQTQLCKKVRGNRSVFPWVLPANVATTNRSMHACIHLMHKTLPTAVIQWSSNICHTVHWEKLHSQNVGLCVGKPYRRWT